MAPVLTRLTPDDYVTTRWAGGTTTQLAIAPKGALYADHDFLWRVSSATVELDESDFTALPDYRRFISTVRGEMTLCHNGGDELTLRPGDVHEFDGGGGTHSRGRCTDFNLMVRKGKAKGGMRVLRVVAAHSSDLACPPGSTMLLYCASGNCTLRCPGAEAVSLSVGEAALVEQNGEDGTAVLLTDGEAAVYAAQVL